MNMSLASVANQMATEESFFQAVQRWIANGTQSDLDSLPAEDQAALKRLFAKGLRFDQVSNAGPITPDETVWWRP